MNKQYQFKYKNMDFSKDGQLDELIALDRYAVPSFEGYEVGDTVVAIVDETMGTKKVATIEIKHHDNTFTIKDRFGEFHTVKEKLMHKPLETEPYQLWERWSKGGSSVEKTKALKESFENELRWLFDGYKYSLGGRIQLMLGQEFVTGKKAQLTAFNCFVVRNAVPSKVAASQFEDVIDVAYKEASIMRRGGGVGLNIGTVETVEGSIADKTDFIFYLDKEHLDYTELQDRILLGKFDDVTVVTSREEFEELIDEKSNDKQVHLFNAGDSVDELFSNMKAQVKESYANKVIAINFNELRERNAIVKGVNGRSSGAVSWMELFVLIANLLQQKTIDNVDFAEIYSEIVHLIIQGGSRRGALMLICPVDNPNIYKFMQRKKTVGKLTGANISVGITDSFMDKVIKGREGEVSEEITEAIKLWNVLIESAWNSAEPGIVWMERYNKESNSWYFHEIIATNPCGN